jgi:PIN domain nuclease of toxin-antitoxin system
VTVAVLDASAFLAMLLREPGAEVVRAVLANSAISSVNLAETISYFTRNGATEKDIRSALDPLPIQCVSFDHSQAYIAGLMLPITRSAGLSLGDRACLALAAHLGVKALTADRAWLSLGKAIGVDLELIRP